MAERRELTGAVGASCRNSRARSIGKACVEALEGRMLLAVTAGDYDTIRNTYPGFNLPADMASVNVIEISASQLSVANLKSAITTAGGTTLPDLVVLRTTDTQNTITYASSSDAVTVDIASTKGAISIVGFGSKPLTIDGANQNRVIYVGSASSTTTVNLGGMTLTRGYSTGYGGGVYQSYGTLTLTSVAISGNTAPSGGGAYLSNGTSTLTNVTISGNTASSSSGGGGGVYQSSGTLTLTNVTISGNTVSSSSIGGGGGVCLSGRSTLTNVTISGNTASNYGGGVYQSSGTSTLTNVTISGNTASSSGGGVYLDFSSATSTLANVAISGNTSSGSGGGMYLYASFSSGKPTLNNVTISGNTASGYGGGIYLRLSYPSGIPALTNVTISGNTSSGYGGGVYLSMNPSSATVTLTNVTISGNKTSSSYGGGVYQSGGTSILTNVTITGNTAPLYSGGGVYLSSGTCTLQNTIVARNAAGTGPDVYQNTGSTLSGSCNLIGDGTGETSLSNGWNGNRIGTSTSPIDPKLAEGSSFGIGLSPLPGSLAIDAGSNSLIPTGITTDIYGAARIQGASVNIGAVETVLAGTPGVTYVVTSLADNIAVDGVVTLREALASANSNQAVGDAPAGSYSSADAITFAPGLSGTIRTNGQAYQITSSVSITGLGTGQLALDGGGTSGVLDIRAANDVSISGMTITGGNTEGGGGVYAVGSRITLSQMVISGNTASAGGGVWLVCGTSTLTNVTISGNTATFAVGGLYQYYGASTLTNVTISGNTGGGMSQNYGTSTLTNVTISGNAGAPCGGGLSQQHGISTLTNVTISGNATTIYGGGVYLDSGTFTLRNTIAAGNAAGKGPDVYVTGTGAVLNGGNNLIGDGSGQTSLVNGVNGNIVGSSASPIDPKLAEGSNFGIGLAPLAGSPAIDAGSNSLIPTGITTDIYGAARIQGARVNIGAVETVVAGTPGLTYVVTSLADSIAADGVVTLREALAAANSDQAVGDAPAGSYSSADVITFAPGLSGSIYTNGQAYRIGGSVSIIGPGIGQLTIDGGGMSRALEIRGVYDVSVSGMTITGGKAEKGGGIYAAGPHLTLNQMVISGNTAIGNASPGEGGGVYLDAGVSTLTNVTISANTGSSSDGGGLYQSYGTSTLTNVTLSGNTARCGGGVFQNYGTLALTNVTISGNTALTGGGAYLALDYGTSSLTNVTISGNRATAGNSGGLIQAYGTTTLTNVTIAGNTASGSGGGFTLSSGTSTVRNTIVARNAAGTNADVYLTGGNPVLNGVSDLVGDGSGQTSLVNGSNGNLVGTSTSLIDPLFVSMSGTDWTTWDLHLQATSPAVNTGNNAWIPTGVTTDIAGGQRIIGCIVDMGAYEQGQPLIVPNHQPTDLLLSANPEAENQPVGTVVGTFSTMDPDAGDAFAYWLVLGTGSTDNASFSISGNQLMTAASLDFETKASYSVRVRTNDDSGLACERVFTITITDVNDAPTAIALSSSNIAENQPSSTTVGTFSTTDQDIGNTFTYSLVSGTGSTDNGSFTISGNTLMTAAPFNYEAKSGYSIRVRTADQDALWYEKVFTISVTNVNEVPTNITLSVSSIAENRPTGTTVGTLSTTDPDNGNTFAYSLVSGAGSSDNGSFTISGSTLKTAGSFNFEAKNSYSIRVRTADQGGLWCEKAFTISVTDVNETPTDLALSSASVAENQPVGTTVGTLSSTDPDAGNTFAYSLVSGTGSTDNSSFTISGNQLLTSASFDYEAKNSYSVRIRSTDQGGLWVEKALAIAVTDVDEIAPTVTAVYVRGSTWAAGYLSFLAANLAGSSATYGYAIPVGTGATQLQTLPWRNLNRISIAFSEDVSVAQAQFAIVGSVGGYSVSGFSYSAADHVATWSLSAVIGPDKLYMALPGSESTPVKDAAGNVLDGEWTNPGSFGDAGPTNSFPSGNGSAGGDFAFRLDVLPGDSTGGSLGKVNVADIAQTKSRSGPPVSISSYRSDFDGNNLVNVADIAYVKSRSGINSLPVNPPVLPMFGSASSQVSLLLKSRALRLW